ncbi:MAG: hypothetical protein KDJ69_09400 [Nitratireductor sp.]|nr:hypothetical protein [Nitratireductor sp.]
MKRPGFVTTCLLAAAIALPQIHVAADAWAFGSYASPDKIMRTAKQMRRQGKYPASLRCSADLSQRYIKPEVEVDWRENTRNVDWEMYVYKGQLEFQPGEPGKNSGWKRVSRTVIPLGGTKFICLLYYKR